MAVLFQDGHYPSRVLADPRLISKFSAHHPRFQASSAALHCSINMNRDISRRQRRKQTFTLANLPTEICIRIIRHLLPPHALTNPKAAGITFTQILDITQILLPLNNVVSLETIRLIQDMIREADNFSRAIPPEALLGWKANIQKAIQRIQEMHNDLTRIAVRADILRSLASMYERLYWSAFLNSNEVHRDTRLGLETHAVIY